MPTAARLLALLLAVVALGLPALTVAPARAAAKLDASFGAHGRVALGNYPYPTIGALALDPAGDVLVADEADGFAVRRLTPAGRDDPAFGRDGRIVLAARSSAVASAVTLDAQRRLLVAGPRGGGGLLVARLNADGTVDPSFGTNGQTLLNPPHPAADEHVVKLVVTPDGVLVLASDLVLARLTPTGQLDDGFGDHGYVALPTPPVDASADSTSRRANDVLARPDGTLLALTETEAAGYHYDVSSPVVSLVSPEGTIERASSISSGDAAEAILPAPDDGFFLAGGEVPDMEESTFGVLRRFHADGSPDGSFGHRGTVSVSGAFAFDASARAGAFDPGGRLVVATPSGVLRYDQHGHRDDRFGACGIAATPDIPVALALQDAREMTLARPEFGPRTASLFAVRPATLHDPHAAPVFGPSLPVLHGLSVNDGLRSLIHGPVITTVETPQATQLVATLRTTQPVRGLPRILARWTVTTRPCRAVMVDLRASPTVRRALVPIRRALKRDDLATLDVQLRVTLNNRAGTRTHVELIYLTSY